MRVNYTRAAEKEILSLNKALAERIALKTKVLEETPFPSGFQKLSGNKGYRIRIGDYRVVYIVDKVLKTVTIIKVQHRKEVYR